MRRTVTTIVVAGLSLLALGAAPPPAPPPAESALRKALPWLSSALSRLPDVRGTPRKPFTLAVAGLVARLAGDAGLPGLSAERLKDVHAALRRFVEEVEARTTDPAALPPRHGLASSEFLVQYTWPLGAAALFLAEEVQRDADREAAALLRRVVALLRDAQAGNGGFGHGRIRPAGAVTPGSGPAPSAPFPDVPLSYPETLLAATNCVVAGLGAAARVLGRDAFPGRDAAVAYYRAARLPNGSFPYDPSQRAASADPTGVSRSAGALLALWALGVPPADPDFALSFDFVTDRMDRIAEGHGSPALNLALAALACRALGDAPFSRFRAEYYPRIIAAQADDGSFRCVCRRDGFGVTCDSDETFSAAGPFAESQHTYVTALGALVLLLDRAPPKVLAAPAPWPAPARPVPTERPRPGR